jgi:hypothetical protein
MQADHKPGLFDSAAAIEKLLDFPKRRAMWLSGTSQHAEMYTKRPAQ